MELRKTKPTIEYGNLFFCMAVTLPSLVYLFTKTVRLVIRSTASLDTLLVYLAFAFVFVKALPELRYAFTRRDLALVFSGGILLAVSAMSPVADMGLLMSTGKDIVFRCLPVYLGAKLVHDSPRLSQYLRLFAVILLLRVMADVYVFSADSAAESYYQFDGYLLLTAIALLFLPLIQEHRIYDIVLAGAILLATLLTGARGPFLAAVLLVFTGILLGGTDRRQSLLRLVLPAGSAYLIYRYMRPILTFIMRTFGSAASMRTVQRLLDNALLEDSGRARIYATVLSYLREHLFWGCGALNDRVILHDAVRGIGPLSGSYPHNIFLEFAMQFGVILGTVLMMLLVAQLLRAWRRCRSHRERLVLVSLLFSGIVPLMVSGSYLTFTMFYALIGFCTRRAGTFGEDETLAQAETMGKQALS